MANRVQTPDPLLGATPALRPMARPIQVQPGATPPPRQSPIMELANAFSGINEELRDMLRDTAAREERDAMALGELEATKARAEGRMAELDRILKEKVDKGELPSVRLPAAQRGAALRAGHEHAEVGFQTWLLSKKEEAVRGDLEAIVNEGLQRFSSNIPEEAFFERVGFDKAATEIVGRFRARVAQEQAVEADRFQKEKRANEGAELAFQLATADADNVPIAKDLLKTHLDSIRGEMPKSEVNPFFSKNVLAPAVARLVEQKDFDGAAQLLEEIKTLDLTGKGGLYGKTTEGSEALLQLSTLVETKRRNARNDHASELANARQEADEVGRKAAAEAVYTLRQQNAGKLPLDQRQALLADGLKKLDALQYQSFSAIINSEFENDERFRQNPIEGAKLLNEVETLDPQQLERLQTKADLLLTGGVVSADVYHRASLVIRQNQALAGAVKEKDVEDFQKAVFAAPGLLRGTTTINVGDDKLVNVWDGLDENARTELRVTTADYFVENFRQQLRLLSKGNPAEIENVKVQAFDKASTLAREFAKGQLSKQRVRKIEDETRAQEKAQAEAIAKARSLQKLSDSPFKTQADFTTNAIDFRGVPEAKLSDAEIVKAYQKDRELPRAERDFASVSFRSKGVFYPFKSLKDYRVVSLPALATKAQEKPDSEDAALYAVAKATLGFTPEEIKVGKTKHGVLFDASQIDPRVIPVFRSVAELNKHWANGEFDETFAAVGDSIDPGNTITPQAFYLAQVALLSK